MKLLVTGATGFLGQYVVAEALRKGHKVRAMVRPAVDTRVLPWDVAPSLEYARLDMRVKSALADEVRDVDCVIHLAAQMEGDIYAQFEGTVITTENLLSAMLESDVRHIVLISSFSVYGYIRRRAFSTIDEDSPLEERLDERDDYARTKTIQENLVRACAEEHDWTLTVMRPGVIYGEDRLFGARCGLKLSDTIWLGIGSLAQLPLTYVENCAQAIIVAVSCPDAAGQTFNVLDDDPPTQRRFARELQRRTVPRPRIFFLPWTVLRLLAAMASLTNKAFFRGEAKLPSILVPARLHARFKPLRYSNSRIHNVLDWTPRYILEEALDRCFMDGSLLGPTDSDVVRSKRSRITVSGKSWSRRTR